MDSLFIKANPAVFTPIQTWVVSPLLITPMKS